MKRISCLAIVLGLVASVHAADVQSELAARLDSILNRHADTGAIIHARVIELPSRRELYARRADEPCTPASNFKLLTSAAALDLFGPDHSFKTYLAMDGDDLWLIGTGDPGTGDPRLAKARGGTPVTMLGEWAKALEKRGVREIKGDLVYYDGALEELQVHPSWPKGWLLHWYAAPTSGLNFNDNCIDVTVKPGDEGKPVSYSMMPPVTIAVIANECVTGGKGSPSIVKRRGGNLYTLRGACTKPAELMSKPVEDPAVFFADALREQLRLRGITIAGQIRQAHEPLGGTIPPPSDKIVATYETPIRDVLSRVNKNSQNLFAECLAKLTGQEFERRRGQQIPGSWDSGGKALRLFLRRIGIDDTHLAPMDGSGLSPANRLTTRMLTELLAVMHGRDDAEVYRESLTICGVDGSLRDRMQAIKERVFGKTGYIGGVSATSGYLQTRSGAWLAFSFIFNRIPEKVEDDVDVQAFTKLQDEACVLLADGPNIPASQPTTAAAAH